MTLREYLTQRGLTQPAFARRIGVHRSTVFKLVHGARPHKTTAQRIIRATGGRVGKADLFPVPA